MPSKRCCPNCFDDVGLRDDIFPTLEPVMGNCDYCLSQNVPLILPTQLIDYFGLLADVYEPDPAGKSLVEWMKEHWLLFSHPIMDVAHAKELIGDIFEDAEVGRIPVIPSPSYASDGLALWETLRDEMMHKNRWFLDVEIDKDRLEQLFDLLTAKELPNQWFRARIMPGDQPFALDQMGAPPKRLASHGRANPAGIPYLYLGSQPQTAVAEVRPHTGEQACVAEFTAADIKAVDLRRPRWRVSPFILSGAAEIGQLLADLPFLERLGEELTRPVLPSGAAIDYIPSQYLCEIIKKRNYDGVIYRSSVSSGFNLALFNSKKAMGANLARYKVESVSVDISAVAE